MVLVHPTPPPALPVVGIDRGHLQPLPGAVVHELGVRVDGVVTGGVTAGIVDVRSDHCRNEVGARGLLGVSGESTFGDVSPNWQAGDGHDEETDDEDHRPDRR